ncbi:MAG: 2-C-methyl-D-erythritol 4-phosphate cytidylyltransferase [Bacteroidota bacterium]
MRPFALVIPAAGSGRRMGTEIPKPFLTVGNRMVLEHTVRAFLSVPGLEQIVIVTRDEWIDPVRTWREWVPDEVEWTVVHGGRDRADSVGQGLAAVRKGVDLVAIHDAVRPFVPQERVTACLDRAAETGAAILAIPVRDTIKRVDTDRGVVLETPDRDSLWQAQTPQIFDREILDKAYRMRGRLEGITDDASLVEASGQEVSIVEGDVQNFKLTWPVERLLAERLLEERPK